MGMVTIDQVIRWRPCSDYPRKRINSLFAGRESLSWEDIVALDIPTEDKLWALLREDFIPARELHLLACDFAEKVLHLTDDPRCAEVIRVKRIWVDGKATYEELAAAWDAALDAALDAARDAAWAAALDAALAAARAAARDAARDAARAAARAAAWDAARAAQLAMTVEVLRRLA